MGHVHSYPAQTSQGTAACEAVVPSGPARSTSLALPWTGRATAENTGQGEKDRQKHHKRKHGDKRDTMLPGLESIQTR